MAIESVNPSLPGGRDGEGGMVKYLSAFFEGIGLPVELTEALPGRHNLVARLEGEDPDRALLFECHMDTASVEVMTIPPFEPHIRDGLMYGRGSADTKAGGVAMMHAMKRLFDAGVKPPRTIRYAGSVDEEYLMRGALAPRIDVEAAVIAEPTDLEVIRGHKGVVRFHVAVEGKAAHSSKPYLGVNAISGMARLVTRLEEVIGSDYACREDPLLGSPTMNIGVIEGGMQVNFVPDRCRTDVDVRMIPGQTADGGDGSVRQRHHRGDGCRRGPRGSLHHPRRRRHRRGGGDRSERGRRLPGGPGRGGDRRRALRHGRQSLRRPRGADDHPRARQHRPSPRRRGVGRVPAGDPGGGRVPADHAEPGVTLLRCTVRQQLRVGGRQAPVKGLKTQPSASSRAGANRSCR